MLFSKFVNLFKNTNNIGIKNNVLYFSKLSNVNQNVTKPVLRQPVKKHKIGPLGWFLLIIPASTFALGTWQVQRKKWKEALIANLHLCTTSDPVPLPNNLQDLGKMEYKPVHVRGEFLHDRELYMGPRSLIVRGDAATQSSLMTTSSSKSNGYLVITPLKLSNSDEVILVNRGWVPAKNKNPSSRQKGQVQGEVDVIGIVRLHENRPNFMPQNRTDKNLWFYRDLQQMASKTGSLPVFLDATDEHDVPGGPVGGQTRISLRNEHLSYIFTWYGLCAGTSILWYKQFIK